MSRRRFDRTESVENLQMDDEVYKLRRRVMDYIYEAKEVCNLPRITVRVVKNCGEVKGVARMRDNIIWIPEGAISEDEYDLRHIVYHELLHAVYGVGHVDTCELMKPTIKKHNRMTSVRLKIF